MAASSALTPTKVRRLAVPPHVVKRDSVGKFDYRVSSLPSLFIVLVVCAQAAQHGVQFTPCPVTEACEARQTAKLETKIAAKAGTSNLWYRLT